MESHTSLDKYLSSCLAKQAGRIFCSSVCLGNQCCWCQDDAKEFYSWVDKEFVAEHGVWLAWAPVKSTLKRSVFPLVFPTKPNLISHVFVLEVLLYSCGFDDTWRSISTTLPAQLGPSSRPTRIYRPCPLLSTTNMLGPQELVEFTRSTNHMSCLFKDVLKNLVQVCCVNGLLGKPHTLSLNNPKHG